LNEEREKEALPTYIAGLSGRGDRKRPRKGGGSIRKKKRKEGDFLLKTLIRKIGKARRHRK